ncbi:TrkH family potassium uptake protein [Melioribacteraceae bacterium 4301-Me]|uniref:TrkH family potassium uptake protein n=1 Tax=Pyranulibacter aquaticus TaxID=3163344 RepID=UPI003595A6FB
MKSYSKTKVLRFLKVVVIISSLFGLLSIVLEYGFRISGKDVLVLHYISLVVIGVFILYQYVQFFLSDSKLEYLKSHIVESIISVLIVVELILSLFNLSLVEKIGRIFNLKNIAYLYIVFAQIFIVIGIIVGGLRYNRKILQSKINPSRLFILSFFFTIMVGTFLLMLPAATVKGSISFIDALFTSTSAVCVTGLITVDTATYFTKFGQVVIMLLFQIGGLGLMTFTTFFALFLAGGLGIKERIVLNDLLNEENLGAVTKILSYLLLITFTVEIIGAVILFLSSHKSFASTQDAVFTSLFHSISAFCNAGFSLFSLNLMDPIVKTNYVYTTTIAMLIIIGGIGFPTIMSILNFRKITERHRAINFNLPLQTRIVLMTTLLLIVFGTFITYILEYDNSLRGMNFFAQLHAAFFQSVTARTAGFNTINFGSVYVSTAIFYYFLMFVGASPGGTGGGIKTTTFAILIKGTYSILKNQKNVVIKNRSISNEIVIKALIKTGLSIFFITLGIFFLTMTEKANLADISFEAFSAFGTVGLSRGITFSLTGIGKFVIVMLMFIGRVGPISFLYTFMRKPEPVYYDLPGENISIL